MKSQFLGSVLRNDGLFWSPHLRPPVSPARKGRLGPRQKGRPYHQNSSTQSVEVHTVPLSYIYNPPREVHLAEAPIRPKESYQLTFAQIRKFLTEKKRLRRRGNVFIGYETGGFLLARGRDSIARRYWARLQHFERGESLWGGLHYIDASRKADIGKRGQ